MDKLHASYIKIVTAGGDLDAASQRKLTKDVVGHKMTGVVVERPTSQNPNPDERNEIGTTHELRFVMQMATQDDYVTIFGGANTSEIYTKTQGIRALPKYDIRVAVYRASDGLLVLKDWTDMNLIPEMDEMFEQGKIWHLPVVAKSTDTSDYTSDNSAS